MVITALVGFLFGFIGSMPIAGPIAVLVLARALEGRLASALKVGIGGAVAETAYALLAFWGFSELLAADAWIVPVSRGAAAVILLGLGIVFLRREPTAVAAPPPAPGRDVGAFLLGLSISGLNPTLIATWTAAATTLFSTGLVAFSPGLAVPFGLGAGLGIAAWTVVLVRIVARYRDRFEPATIDRMVRWMGGFLLLVSLLFAWRLISWLLGWG